jgi:hypothetical protein
MVVISTDPPIIDRRMGAKKIIPASLMGKKKKWPLLSRGMDIRRRFQFPSIAMIILPLKKIPAKIEVAFRFTFIFSPV